MKAEDLIGKTVHYRPPFTGEIKSAVVSGCQKVQNLRGENFIFLSLDNGNQVNADQVYFDPSAA